MILASLLGTVLLASVATGPLNDSTGGTHPSAQENAREKLAATQPLVRSATDCIVRAVVADPRYGKEPAAKLGDLIVDSMPTCLTPLRAMIDAFDQYFGDGKGEAFFMGPYLDVLPQAVSDAAKKPPR
jgi:hypothetical protein